MLAVGITSRHGEPARDLTWLSLRHFGIKVCLFISIWHTVFIISPTAQCLKVLLTPSRWDAMWERESTILYCHCFNVPYDLCGDQGWRDNRHSSPRRNNPMLGQTLTERNFLMMCCLRHVTHVKMSVKESSIKEGWFFFSLLISVWCQMKGCQVCQTNLYGLVLQSEIFLLECTHLLRPLRSFHSANDTFSVRQITSVLLRLNGLTAKSHQLGFTPTVCTSQSAIISEPIHPLRFMAARLNTHTPWIK